MTSERARQIIEDLKPKERFAVLQMIEECLHVGLERPAPELLGYSRYNAREQNFQDWLRLSREKFFEVES